MADKTDESEALKRLGGGRWQTRDGRFTIEPQSGQWVIVDGEQTDELGLPRVRGPYSTLTKAKAAIAGARDSAPPDSPLAERLESFKRDATKRSKKADEAADQGQPEVAPPEATPVSEPEEPDWIDDLAAADRLRARRLLDRLRADGVGDAEDLVHDELIDGQPSLVRHALLRRLAKVGNDDRKQTGMIVELLAEGEDERLDVGWRLVDRDGRPIRLRAADVEG